MDDPIMHHSSRRLDNSALQQRLYLHVLLNYGIQPFLRDRGKMEGEILQGGREIYYYFTHFFIVLSKFSPTQACCYLEYCCKMYEPPSVSPLLHNTAWSSVRIFTLCMFFSHCRTAKRFFRFRCMIPTYFFMVGPHTKQENAHCA